jgi:hypothetical protein
LRFFFFLTACANPLMDSSPIKTNMQSSGSLEINLTLSETGRSVVPGDYQESVSVYEITLSGTQAMGPILVTSPIAVISDLPLGEYTVSAQAIDSDGRTIAAGALASVMVGGEMTDKADVPLLPVMGGKGTISVNYNWSGAGFPEGYIDRAIAVLTPSGGRSFPVDVVISGNGLKYGAELPSGEYTFSCELFSDGVLVSSVTKTIMVFDGLESDTAITMSTGDFRTVPDSPGIAESTQSGLTVTLSWEDTSDLETGYRIYRSEGGGRYSLLGSGLPANTTAWTDGPVVPGLDYSYKIVAVNAFGESAPQIVPVTVLPPVLPPAEDEARESEIVLGDPENILEESFLIAGFENTMNRSDLEITAVSVEGGGSARLENGNVIVDVSTLPYEDEGGEIILNYTVHISGEPLNDTYSSGGTAVLNLAAPEVEEIAEEDLLEPVQAYIYDDRAAMERKMRLYEPQNPQEIFDNWGRLSNHMYFKNVEDARLAVRSKGDEAGLALEWKLKNEGGSSFIEYARNSVYAGFVSPDGQEMDKFTLEATVSSKDDDDDTAGLIVAFLRDGDSNYVLEAARSRGSSSGSVFVDPRKGWGLLVRRLSKGDANPEIGEVLWVRQINVGGAMSGGWKNLETRIRVERNGDVVRISASNWNDKGRFSPESLIEVNLNSDRQLSRFKGPRKFGYFTASQERMSFRDISMDGGMIQDKMFYLNPATGDSEVWWFDTGAQIWIRMAGTDIQSVLGYPLEVTNPETGLTFLVERRGFRRGRWQDR